MKKRKRTTDPNMPMGKLTEVPDFLPPPEELAKAKTVITINLDRKTIEYFKKQAKKRGGKYQQMIREILNRYAEYYGGKAA